MANDRVRADALAREIEDFFRQRGLSPVDCRGDRYIGVGRVSRREKTDSAGNSKSSEVFVDRDDKIEAILCLADLADHIVNVWDGR